MFLNDKIMCVSFERLRKKIIFFMELTMVTGVNPYTTEQNDLSCWKISYKFSSHSNFFSRYIYIYFGSYDMFLELTTVICIWSIVFQFATMLFVF